MTERLSDHCALLGPPGEPPRPEVRPADCPEDAVYIKTTSAGGNWVMQGQAPSPVVFEGGDGNDGVTIIGKTGNLVIVDGGKGDDQMTLVDNWSWMTSRLSAQGTAFVGVTAIVFAALVAIVWKGLATKRHNRRF